MSGRFFCYKRGDILKIYVPEYVNKVTDTLLKNGFEVYVVGGAVRDAVMGKKPDDWDVTTNAGTDDIKKCFKKHFDTGIKHGTVTVISDKMPVEVTTYRIDGEYKDSRHPETVVFTSDLKEDLKRRDFTVNAIAYNEKEGIVDCFGGISDIENKIIRCVGDADKRFSEDALRIMRAVRFASTLGFSVECDTFASVQKNAYLLKNISAERIFSELKKTLSAHSGIDILFSSRITEVIMPEISDNSDIIMKMPEEICDRLFALLYKTDINLCRNILNRLKSDNFTKKKVLSMLECAYGQMFFDKPSAREMIGKYGFDTVKSVLLLFSATGKDMKKQFEILEYVKYDPCRISDLDIRGNDILNLGFSGKDTGEILKYLLLKVISDPKLNKKEKLIKLAESIKQL